MAYLSEHFSLAELTVTDQPYDNVPNPTEMKRLQTLAAFMEKVRAILGGHPITVNSAFRSEAVNEAVGGVYNSAHRLGYACDFTCAGFGTPFEVAEKLSQAASAGLIAFDQLIYEQTWVHIARTPTLRAERLTKTDTGYTEGILA